ncbi:MAG: response regulator [Planctomycetota bacterium]
MESLPSLEGLRVLLVEDSPTNRNLFVFLLEREGIQLGIACDGREALAEVERANAADEAYDVILMDMQMPVLDGYSAAAELRRRGETTPIIALTAQAMVGDRERCLAAGCTAYVPKPVDRRMLLSEILAAVTLESDPTA